MELFYGRVEDLTAAIMSLTPKAERLLGRQEPRRRRINVGYEKVKLIKSSSSRERFEYLFLIIYYLPAIRMEKCGEVTPPGY